MSKSNAFENYLLKLIFNATAIANLADNAAFVPDASEFRDHDRRDLHGPVPVGGQ